MNKHIIVVGAGIGGMAAALAQAQKGWQITLLEQASQFSEVGAGIQLGPNAVRLLQAWGLGPALQRVASFAPQLEVRSALHGGVLAALPLGEQVVARYGAAYATLARADLHAMLLRGAEQTGSVALHMGKRLSTLTQDKNAVTLSATDIDGQTSMCCVTPVLLGADGIWSHVRAHVLGDEPPRWTGHWAYRSMVPQSSLPAALRSQVITAWLGPNFHAVQYPVRCGEWLNIVVVVRPTEAPANSAIPDESEQHNWNHAAHAHDLQHTLRHSAAPLQALVQAAPHWSRWMLHDRPPMRSPKEHTRGRVAMLGDASHPMRPFLAQGAGMALEDAAALTACLNNQGASDLVQALRHYAKIRWQRNARVQARALRNGQIFHLQGPMRLARDTAMRLLGPRLLDLPWLYRGPHT